MSLNSSLSQDVVRTAIDEVFYGAFDYTSAPGIATARDAMLFRQDTIDRNAVIVDQYQGPGYFTERAEEEDVSSATPRVGNQKTFPVANWARSVDIPKNFFDDEQFSVVERTVERMGRNGRMTQDKEALKAFRDGFSTVLTNDGVALFSNSHVTLTGDTVDNLETAALTDASLEAAVVSLMEQQTQDGTLGGFTPSCLLVPPARFADATKITKSELTAGTADNDINYYSTVYPGLVVKQSPFLGAAYGGSDTAWYLMSQNHSMYRWVRQDIVTDMVDYKYQRNNSYVYKAEFREVVGPVSYEGLVGSTGVA